MGWYGGSSGGGGGMAIGGAVTGSISGSVLFADGSGHLAQNNADFFWDNTNLNLKLGHSGTDAALYLNTLPAIYVVTNAIENNWFEGNAGNQSVTGYGNFGTGDLALSSLTSGYDNVAIGTKAMRLLTDGYQNFALGSFAMSSSTSDKNNTAIGTYTLTNIGLGGANAGGNNQNIAIGYGALNQATIAANNIAAGFSSLSNVTTNNASFNIVMGNQAGNLLGTAYNIFSNVFIGDHAGSNITGGNENVWLGGYRGPTVGINASVALSDGGGTKVLFDYGITHFDTWSINVNNYDNYWGALHIYGKQDAIGAATNYERAVLDWNITSNVFTIGTQAGGTGVLRDIRYYTAGHLAIYRVANGSGDNWFEGDAGNTTVTGFSNFGTGPNALKVVTTGSQNTAIGANALRLCSSGSGNVGIGTSALFSVDVGTNNFAIGLAAGQNITSGSGNFAVGSSALAASVTGDGNTAIGNNALFDLASGSANTALGGNAGRHIASGDQNILMGINAMGALTSGSFNTSIGAYSGFSATSASGSTHIGQYSGLNITASTRNVLIGSWTGPSASVSDMIGISSGFNGSTGNLLLDYNYTVSGIWSIANFNSPTTPLGFHIYNTSDAGSPPTNYERACLDWSLTSNIFRLASQAGGSGTKRLIAIDGFAKAGAPAAGDLPSGTFALVDDTTNNQTWLVFNKGGTIRKVQLT